MPAGLHYPLVSCVAYWQASQPIGILSGLLLVRCIAYSAAWTTVNSVLVIQPNGWLNSLLGSVYSTVGGLPLPTSGLKFLQSYNVYWAAMSIGLYWWVAWLTAGHCDPLEVLFSYRGSE